MVHDANNENTDGIRLVDNGFSMICDMVNDNSMKVRAQAAGLLVRLKLKFTIEDVGLVDGTSCN